MTTQKITNLSEIAAAKKVSVRKIVVDGYIHAFGKCNDTIINRVMRTHHIGLYNDDNLPYWLRDYIDNCYQILLRKRRYVAPPDGNFVDDDDDCGLNGGLYNMP